MNQQRKIIEVGKTYRSKAKGDFVVLSYEPDEPSDLRYTCSDGMYRDKYGRAFPEPLDSHQTDYDAIWPEEF